MNSGHNVKPGEQPLNNTSHVLRVPMGGIKTWNVEIILLLAVAFMSTILNPAIADAQCPVVPVIHTGEATFYTFASGGGACLFDPTPNDLMVGAMNLVDYANAQVCGECVSLTGPNGTIVIRIVDLCPECPQGDIDLSPLAFSMIADTSLGRVPIAWRVVACGVTGPVQYHFKDGSNQWWTAVQIRNHRYPILRLEYVNSQGNYQSVNRVDYNYFVESSGMGPGPYTFRVTDIYGHTLVDTGIPHIENGSVSGHAQFPLCDDPLPIQLTGFRAVLLNQRDVRLDWRTLTEINNFGFEVQVSETAGQVYRTIPNSFIPGHGTTIEPHDYSFTHVAPPSGELQYRLKLIDLDGRIHYSDPVSVTIATAVAGHAPPEFALFQNYPNPFNPTTTIRYSVATYGHISIKVFDLLGREVATLMNETQHPGEQTIVFDARSLGSGVYTYRLESAGNIHVKRLLLLR